MGWSWSSGGKAEGECLVRASTGGDSRRQPGAQKRISVGNVVAADGFGREGGEALGGAGSSGVAFAVG